MERCWHKVPPRRHRLKSLSPKALARLGTTRFRHGYLVSSIAFSRDGKILASGGNGRALCLWDARTGRLLHHCIGQRFPAVSALAFSPDGSMVADCEGMFVKLWSVETGKELRRCNGHTNRIFSVAFAPNGMVLASASQDNTIRVWDTATGRVLRVLEGHTGIIKSLAFRDDGKVLAAASSDGTVRLLDPATGTPLHICKGHRKAVLAVAFEPGGKRLVSSSLAGGVRLWHSDTGKQERLLATEEGQAFALAFALAFAPNGRTIAVSRGGTIVLQDPSTGKEIHRWQAHVARINAMAWSPDGRTLASGAASDSTVHLWDPKTGQERTTAQDGHISPIHHVQFDNAGGRLFSISQKGRSLEWDLETRKSRSLASAWPATMGANVFSITPDRKVLALTSGRPADPVIHLYETATSKKLHSLSGHQATVMVVDFDSAGQRLISLSRDHTVRAWQVSTGEQLWQAQVGAAPDSLQASFAFVRSLAFSPDGKSVACSLDSTVHLLDAATGKELRKYQYGQSVYALAWSPDGSQVALVGGLGAPDVALWDTRTGLLSRSWKSPQSGIFGIAFSPDGRFLATGGDIHGSSVYVWEWATGGKVASFDGHHSGVWKVVFSPDNRTLASGGGDSSILLWDMTRRMRDGKLPPAAVSATRFEHLWENLADPDAAVGHAAIWELVTGGQTVLTMLKKNLPIATAINAAQAAKLVERLDSDNFATRDVATKEASQLGLGIESVLMKALVGRPGLEPRRRVEALIAGWLRSSDWLRFRRAVAVLEYNGSAEAKRILSALAAGAEGARPTKEAAAALARLREHR